MILQSFDFFQMSQRESRKRSATISSCHCCDGESTCTAVTRSENSKTTQSGVDRVAARISSSGTVDVSSAGVNMDIISCLPKESKFTNCFVAAFESGLRTRKPVSKHSRSRKKTKTTPLLEQLLWSKVYQTLLLYKFNLVHMSGQLNAGKRGTISRL